MGKFHCLGFWLRTSAARNKLPSPIFCFKSSHIGFQSGSQDQGQCHCMFLATWHVMCLRCPRRDCSLSWKLAETKVSRFFSPCPMNLVLFLQWLHYSISKDPERRFTSDSSQHCGLRTSRPTKTRCSEIEHSDRFTKIEIMKLRRRLSR